MLRNPDCCGTHVKQPSTPEPLKTQIQESLRWLGFSGLGRLALRSASFFVTVAANSSVTKRALRTFQSFFGPEGFGASGIEAFGNCGLSLCM